MLSDEILVMTDMDETKTLEELEFHDVPIWVRVGQLPFGMMNRGTALVLGDEIGKFVDTDVEPGGKAVGAFLRIKVRIDIWKPLMRGVTVLVGKEGHETERWCPLTYEFLLDFCFVCGRIGHVDKICSVKLEAGERKQFDRAFVLKPDRRKRRGVKQWWRMPGSWRLKPGKGGSWTLSRQSRWTCGTGAAMSWGILRRELNELNVIWSVVGGVILGRSMLAVSIF